MSVETDITIADQVVWGVQISLRYPATPTGGCAGDSAGEGPFTTDILISKLTKIHLLSTSRTLGHGQSTRGTVPSDLLLTQSIEDQSCLMGVSNFGQDPGKGSSKIEPRVIFSENV